MSLLFVLKLLLTVFFEQFVPCWLIIIEYVIVIYRRKRHACKSTFNVLSKYFVRFLYVDKVDKSMF